MKLLIFFILVSMASAGEVTFESDTSAVGNGSVNESLDNPFINFTSNETMWVVQMYESGFKWNFTAEKV